LQGDVSFAEGPALTRWGFGATQPNGAAVEPRPDLTWYTLHGRCQRVLTAAFYFGTPSRKVKTKEGYYV